MLPSPLLSARNLAIGFSPKQTLARDLSLDLLPGEIIFLLGRNGVGKSTLLRTLAGLRDPLSGTISYGSQEIESLSAKAKAKYRAVLFPTQLKSPTRVRELVSLGRLPYADWSGQISRHDQGEIDRSLLAVGCGDWNDRWVDQLSDGEKQRVLLAKTIAQGTSILLLDEPTAFIDLPQRMELAKVLKRWARQAGRGVILSTHDLDLAMATADQIWILESGGSWTSGIPEELAMSGTLGRVFESPEATIDRATGRLIWCQTGGPTVTVIGHGPWHDWTIRALIRAGYQINDRSEVVIRVGSSLEGASPWSLSIGLQTEDIRSLAELLRVLNQKHPA
jgi:iron complex transport system ATP-binding protein